MVLEIWKRPEKSRINQNAKRGIQYAGHEISGRLFTSLPHRTEVMFPTHIHFLNPVRLLPFGYSRGEPDTELVFLDGQYRHEIMEILANLDATNG